MENVFFKMLKTKVPHQSAHPLNHFSAGTGTCGTLIPFMCKEIVPGKVNLTPVIEASLANLAADAFMKCSLNLEVFFVPTRLTQKGFAKWFTGEPNSASKYAQKEVFTFSGSAGGWTTTSIEQILGSGTLADYLGWKFTDSNIASMVNNNIFPRFGWEKFVAYHLIWDTYYRNSKIQKSCFLDEVPASSSTVLGNIAKYITNQANYSSSPHTVHLTTINPNDAKATLADSVSIFSLRQRNWDLDYFTSATVSPQQGSAQSVSFDTSGATGSFTIAALRASNSLQQWRELNGIAGFGYDDWLYANYGVSPNANACQKPLYLGRHIVDVKVNGVYTTSGTTTSVTANATNPFRLNAGTSIGRAYGRGAGSILRKFEAKEPGYIFVIGSLVPRCVYSNGIIRENFHYLEDGSVTDMAIPMLQNLGQQPIYTQELYPIFTSSSPDVYGYTDRYAEFMTAVDELHGLLRDEQSLSPFALQRSFGSAPSINTSFLQIPINYLDQVMTYNGNGGGTKVNNGFDYWYDCYFDFKVSHPLHEYSLPSLQNPAYEHGKTIVIRRTGQKLG